MKTRWGSRRAATLTAGGRLLALLAFVVMLAGGFADAALAADGAWVKQTSGTTSQLNSVFFVDEMTGWAVGNMATVLHTTDGGMKWTPQAVPVGTDYDLTGVDFIDSTTGWIAADGPDTGLDRILRTQDGGATWVAATVPPTSGYSRLADVDFFDAGHGVAGGAWSDNAVPCSLASSGDGGMTWTSHSTTPWLHTMDVAWADATNVWACGVTMSNTPGLLRSSDEGAHWSRAQTPVNSSITTGGLTDVEFVDATHGWAVAAWIMDSASGNGPVMLYTADGGVTWQHRHWSEMGLGSTDGPGAVDFVDLTRGWMVGGTRTWHTTDGGLAWQSVQLPETAALMDVDFVSDSCGWAVGWDGRIFHYAILSDTTPPITTAGGYDSEWHNHDVHVNLTVVDTGSGPDRFEVSYDGGAWTPFDVDACVGIIVVAKADHTNDGAHNVAYRGVDKAGNVETPKNCTVRIDTRQPTTKAPSSATARRGRTVALKYRVRDTVPNGGKATVFIMVKNRVGKVVKTLKLGVRAVNTAGAMTAKFTVPRIWKTGTYKFLVYATDVAGNAQSTIGSNKLAVR